MAALPAYSVVIATFERAQDLRDALASLAAQTHLPAQVVVVDSSRDEESEKVCASATGLSLTYERAREPSAAKQRNQGAERVTTELIAFSDDDSILPPETCAKLAAVFTDETVGGVAARLEGPSRPVPKGLLRAYYRLQAGYEHPTYGAQLFGPAINCYPSYTEAAGELIPAQWLSSTCVFYRTALFQREKFPSFAGYSSMEDVHLSARIGKTHRLFFHASAPFEHRDATSQWKRNHRALARSRIRNQRTVAREVLGFTGAKFELKLLLHRLFVSLYLLRRRGPGTWGELVGTWT
jgi:GT2 family glycosyltransferase